MHADHRHCLDGLGPIDELQVDHRVALVGITLTTRLHTRLAADAAALVEEEFHGFGNRHGTPSFPYCCGSSCAAYSGGASAFWTRTAQTLYSGILEMGSWAAMVTWLMLFGPAQ